MIFDVAVIGLGPAGATLARLLAGRFSVIALDKKQNTPGGFQKPCGGLLAPDAQHALARFSLTLPRDVLASPQIFAVRTLDLEAGLERYYPRFYLNMNRDAFDRWQISLIPPQVSCEMGAVATEITKEADGCFTVHYLKNGEPRLLRAKKIVGGEGSRSLVRKTFFRDDIPRYLALQEWYPAQDAPPVYASIFHSKITDCYAWSAPKSGRMLLGAALPVKGAAPLFHDLKDLLLPYGYRFENLLQKEGCLVSRPRAPRHFQTAREGAFLIGEAAGFISPSSLEGISYALESALALSHSLGNENPEKAYHHATLPIRLKLLSKIGKTPFLYSPLLRKAVMLSGVQSLKMQK